MTALLGLTHCTTAAVTSARNPSVAPAPYDRVVVWVNIADLGLRQDAERRFVRRAIDADYSVRMLPACELFYPGRSYSPSEVAEQLDRSSAAAVLYVVATGAGNSEDWIPPFITSAGGVTAISGGYPTSKPYQNYEIRLVDAQSREVVWYATAAISGNAFADHRDLINRMVDEVLLYLAADGFSLWKGR